MSARLVVFACLALSTVGCDAQQHSSTPADVGPASETPAVVDADAPPAFLSTLQGLDPAGEDSFAEATSAFVAAHGEAADADALRADLDALLAFVDETAAQLDPVVQGDPALLATACAEVGVDCGPQSESAAAVLQGYRDRGVRFDYAGEGTVHAVVDHGTVADALQSSLPDGATAWLRATDATQRAESRYDEGGFSGDPTLMTSALLQWEALAVSGDATWSASAQPEVARLRTAFLRLCDHGEWETPPCNARQPLRDAYAKFLTDHADSPSAPAVAVLRAGLKSKRWKATAEQLDTLVAEALAKVK